MKALVLLNMGGARSKDELKTFLLNMFNDKNILTMQSDKFRSILANFITNSRLDKAWENYEQIGGKSPLHQYTEQLVEILNTQLDNYKVFYVMRYTQPFATDIIAQIQQQNIHEVVLLPLYPQYSTTTTKSSIDDFVDISKNLFDISIIEPFYKNEIYNNAICDTLQQLQNEDNQYYVIFSAHGLPQKIINKGDPYEDQLKEHIQILKQKLKNLPVQFQGVFLAYQSKVGPMKWLEPSLDWMLPFFKNKKVIVYPISFMIDNSETVFELSIEYEHLAMQSGLKEYKVAPCLNSTPQMIDIIKDII